MKVSVKDVRIKKERLELMMAKFEEFKKHRIKVGLIGGTVDSESGMTQAELGIIHEFGSVTANIPPRPFISAAARKNQKKYAEALKAICKRVLLKGENVPTLFGVLGAKAAADFKNFVTRGAPIPPENSPAVYERKKKLGRTSNGIVRTLVDTGRMVQAITFAVFKK